MKQQHSHKQSGEPSGQVKNDEGTKNVSHDQKSLKNVKDLRGGDNAEMSDEDFDNYEHQPAGGTHRGGKVAGAHGDETRGSQPDKGM